MTLNVADYIGKRRDHLVERTLVAQLRAIPEEETLAFIREYLDHDQVVGLELARRSLRRRSSFVEILWRGLQQADCSEIKWWLEACVDRLGARRSFDMLERAALKDPKVGRKAIYWFRIILMHKDVRLEARFDAPRNHIGEIGE